MSWTFNIDGSRADNLPGRETVDGGPRPPDSATWDGFDPVEAGDLASTSVHIGVPNPRISPHGIQVQTNHQIPPPEWLKKKREMMRKIASNLQESLNELSSSKMAERVGVCGQYLVMECIRCGQREMSRVVCGHKLCPFCAGKRRWRMVRDLLPLVEGYKSPKFLTVTFPSLYEITKSEIRWMTKCWRRFMASAYIKKRVRGGLRAFEVTYNEETQNWHPHFHVLYDGDWLAQDKVQDIWERVTTREFESRLPLGHPRLEKRLQTYVDRKSKEWRAFRIACERARALKLKDKPRLTDFKVPRKSYEVTARREDEKYVYITMKKGASVIPHIEQVGGRGWRNSNKRNALREVVKYITKVHDFVDDAEKVKEFLDAIHGVRQLIRFGASHAYKIPERPKSERQEWNVDPFTLMGANFVPCRCEDSFLGRSWVKVGIFSREVASGLVRVGGGDDPPPF